MQIEIQVVKSNDALASVKPPRAGGHRVVNDSAAVSVAKPRQLQLLPQMTPGGSPILKWRMNEDGIWDIGPLGYLGKSPVCKDNQFDVPALAYDCVEQLISCGLRAGGLGCA
jgi:hypothetical protein